MNDPVQLLQGLPGLRHGGGLTAEDGTGPATLPPTRCLDTDWIGVDAVSAILSCPPFDTQARTLDIELDGEHVLTVGLASIAPARSAWCPNERVLLLDDRAVTR